MYACKIDRFVSLNPLFLICKIKYESISFTAYLQADWPVKTAVADKVVGWKLSESSGTWMQDEDTESLQGVVDECFL